MAFTAYPVLHVAPPWPRGFEYTFRHAGEEVVVRGQADGRLLVEGPGGRRTTQPILVRHAGNVMLTIVASDSEAPELFLRAGGVRLGLEDSDNVCEVTPSAAPTGRPLSIDHPDARKLCAAWMAKRSAENAPPAAPSAGKRMRTSTEEFQLLLDHGRVLEADVVEAAQGNAGRLQVVQGSLRAMLYEPPPPAKPTKKVNRNWHPLLFRCAALLDMPLPVWAVRPGTVPLAPSLVYWGYASIESQFPTDSLIDLQEWLSWPLVKLDTPHAPTEIDANLFVLKRGSVDGLAHVDPEIPTWFDVLRDVSGPMGTMLAQPTVMLGSIVVVLAGSLLAEATRRGLT